ncbi:MAG: LacI family DNA-binding transcriptional regulator, partial [Oscillospiraceae bacterium]
MKVTVEEIAKIAGVSKATVSRVLNNSANGVSEQTRAHVQEIINKMNYSLDKYKSNNKSMRSRSIALVIPDITNPFFADIAKAVENKAKEEDYIVILSNTDFSETNELKCISNLVSKKVDGIILIPSGKVVQKEHFYPGKYNIPMVLLDRKLEGLDNCPGIYSDNEYASFKACEMMLKSGSNRIVFISGPLGVSTSTERLEGYRLALMQYEIEYDVHLVKYGNYTVESGYNAVIELERAGTKYSAIIAANDMMALGALKALKELSYSIPEQIEIIGFDNITFSQYCEPPLSTIQQPTIEMG